MSRPSTRSLSPESTIVWLTTWIPCAFPSLSCLAEAVLWFLYRASIICSALLETDNGLAVLGFRGNALREIDLDPSEGRDDRDPEKLERILVIVLAKSGYIMGRFPMTTATNVSLTAQLPACCAPFIPAYKRSVTCPMLQNKTCGALTVRMRAHRRIPAIMTNTPPPNMISNQAFLFGSIRACQKSCMKVSVMMINGRLPWSGSSQSTYRQRY